MWWRPLQIWEDSDKHRFGKAGMSTDLGGPRLNDHRRQAAFITGGSSGIGLACARALGAEGYALTVLGRRPDKLAAAAANLREDGFQVNAAAVDFSADDAHDRIAAAVELHRHTHGRIDVLVNSAGIGIRGGIQELSAKQIDKQLSVNLRSLILTVRECIDLLKVAGAEHGNALVINVSSVAGKLGQALLSAYSATKHGVVGFTQSMNRELAASGVKSVALCPGFVDTTMVDIYRKDVPGEEMIPLTDIAETLRYLLRLSPLCLVPEIELRRPKTM